jgi:hypothetical protein
MSLRLRSNEWDEHERKHLRGNDDEAQLEFRNASFLVRSNVVRNGLTRRSSAGKTGERRCRK